MRRTKVATVLSGSCVKEASVNAAEDRNPVVQHLICYPGPGLFINIPANRIGHFQFHRFSGRQSRFLQQILQYPGPGKRKV